MVALVPIGLIGEYSILSSTNALTEKALGELEDNTNFEAEKIKNYLTTCKNDAIFLSESSKVLTYAETKHPLDRWDLEFSLLSVSMDKGYYQVGYIDENTRIYVKDKRIPQEESTMQFDIPELERDEIYVSEIFLKKAGGIFEVPYKPLILFVVPVCDDEKRIGRIYIVAYLTQFFSDFEDSNPEVLLTDSSGNYIYHPDTSKRWSTEFSTEFNKGESLHKDYNTKVDDILSGNQDTSIVGNEIISYIPITIQNQRWVMILSSPKNAILESVYTFKIGLYIVLSAVMISAVFVSYFLSKIITDPLVHLTDATERIADGNLDTTISETGSDELMILANSFNTMSRKLEESYSALENKVEERTAELQLANEKLQTSYEELVKANRAKSKFLANISHELKTPLNSIIGFTEVMLDEESMDEEQRDYLETILRNSENLLYMIEDMLILSRTDAGESEMHFTDFRFSETLSRASKVVKPLVKEKEINVAKNLKDDPLIHADMQKMMQIMLNLLSNAIKFNEEGGEIYIRTIERDGKLRVEVEDTGIGIKEENYDLIFDEFKQVGALETKEHVGTGLGLAITKRFIEAHHGRIWVESKHGKGSTFIFELPIGDRNGKE
ncbi:MAG: ATP-binding protein [Euryarchaeota archaeon]|nr:ATP-binding protein [Euryarchaeota archaeon]